MNLLRRRIRLPKTPTKPDLAMAQARLARLLLLARRYESVQYRAKR